MTGISDRIREQIRLFRTEYGAQPVVILLSATVLLTVYRCYGSSAFFDKHFLHLFNGAELAPLYSVVYSFLSCFFWMLVVPVVLIKLVLRRKVREFGAEFGAKKSGLAVVGVLFPIIAVALLLPASRQAAFRAEYPLFRQAGRTLSLFVLYGLLYGFYYLGWEFFFRGFMLFGLRDAFGATSSILIQTIPSVLMHIGKPHAEIFASIVAGLVFGTIALRTRSFVYVFLLHWLIGVTLDGFIVLSTG